MIKQIPPSQPFHESIHQLVSISPAQFDQLVDVLMDCVAGGASVSFMNPFTRERALAFWQRVAEDVAAVKRLLLVAEDAQGICGTVQLILDLPENQPHRAPISPRCSCIAVRDGRASAKP